MNLRSVYFLLSLFVIQMANSQLIDKNWVRLAATKDQSFLKSGEAKRIAENVLLFQKNNGGWEKNVAMHKVLSDHDVENLLQSKNDFTVTTIDNDATTQEMRFLANVFQFQPDERYRAAFLKGLDYLLKAQY